MLPCVEPVLPVSHAVVNPKRFTKESNSTGPRNLTNIPRFQLEQTSVVDPLGFILWEHPSCSICYAKFQEGSLYILYIYIIYIYLSNALCAALSMQNRHPHDLSQVVFSISSLEIIVHRFQSESPLLQGGHQQALHHAIVKHRGHKTLQFHGTFLQLLCDLKPSSISTDHFAILLQPGTSTTGQLVPAETTRLFETAG